tara:strand:+ start:1239 stop:1826 length:588 start_codon:yes stop_codon:yes gene_type:complete
MVILLIGYKDSKIKTFLEQNNTLYWVDGNKNITLKLIQQYNPEYIILHGCHKILSPDITSLYQNRIINHHGGYLPWCRGAHPNVWSFVKDTPKGGTIHFVSPNIDDGDIIIQKEIKIYPNDTLSNTYWRIRELLETLFIENWEKIINNKLKPKKQKIEIGCLHYRKDLKNIEHLLYDGWNTPIKHIKKIKNEKNN